MAQKKKGKKTLAPEQKAKVENAKGVPAKKNKKKKK
jgi:hypothetical protein